MSKSRLLVSSCLLGNECRYDGKSKYCRELDLLKKYPFIEVIPVCPEMLGFLPCPREPAEIRDKRVVNASGTDVTSAFELGAARTLSVCKNEDIKVAILKESSPSCGSTLVYDGSFKGKKINGRGITAELLLHNGIKIFNELQISEAIREFTKE